MRLVYRIKQLMLGSGDLLCFVIGFWLALLIRVSSIPSWGQIQPHLGPFFVLFLFWIVIIFINGLYDLHKLKIDNLRRFIETAFFSLIFGFIFFYVYTNTGINPKTVLALNVVFGYGFSYVWRLIFNRYINTKALQENLIIIGYSPETAELIKILENFPERGYKIKTLIDLENIVNPTQYPFFDIYKSWPNLNLLISEKKIQTLIITSHLKENAEILKQLYPLLLTGTKIVELESFYEIITGRIPPCTFSEAWFLNHIKNTEQPIYEKIRNGLDYLAAILMSIIFAILFPFIALAIKINTKGPLFFFQTRVGQNGKVFKLYKFRSMYARGADGSAELNGAEFAVKNDTRITKIGNILRKMRIDELPQFINLFKGDITLIGPRPERPEIVAELERIMPYYSIRHIIKPGMTGWAVIHQNYADTLEASLQKLQYDLYYIKNKSFMLDLSIMLRTVNILFRMMGQ